MNDYMLDPKEELNALKELKEVEKEEQEAEKENEQEMVRTGYKFYNFI